MRIKLIGLNLLFFEGIDIISNIKIFKKIGYRLNNKNIKLDFNIQKIV